MSAASTTDLQRNKPPNKPHPRGGRRSPPLEGVPAPEASDPDPKDPPIPTK